MRMRAMAASLLACGAAHAAEDSVCDELIGATPSLRGLCVAYCDAGGSEQVLAAYERRRGPGDPPMPCTVACPPTELTFYSQAGMAFPPWNPGFPVTYDVVAVLRYTASSVTSAEARFVVDSFAIGADADRDGAFFTPSDVWYETMPDIHLQAVLGFSYGIHMGDPPPATLITRPDGTWEIRGPFVEYEGPHVYGGDSNRDQVVAAGTFTGSYAQPEAFTLVDEGSYVFAPTTGLPMPVCATEP
jgi:hypothetical protein